MQQSVRLYLSENCFDIDRQVSMRAAVASHYTESQSIWSSSKSDGLILRRAGGTKRQLGTEFSYQSTIHQSRLLWRYHP